MQVASTCHESNHCCSCRHGFKEKACSSSWGWGWYCEIWVGIVRLGLGLDFVKQMPSAHNEEPGQATIVDWSEAHQKTRDTQHEQQCCRGNTHEKKLNPRTRMNQRNLRENCTANCKRTTHASGHAFIHEAMFVGPHLAPPCSQNFTEPPISAAPLVENCTILRSGYISQD